MAASPSPAQDAPAYVALAPAISALVSPAHGQAIECVFDSAAGRYIVLCFFELGRRPARARRARG